MRVASPPVAAALAIGAATVALLLGGCGGEDPAETPGIGGTIPEPGGTLRIAVAGSIGTLDPLLASTRAEKLAARQVHEPLISSQNGPFGQTRRRPGLVRSIVSRSGDTVWEAELRSGVRFGDGDALDADAVLINAERWLQVAPGPDLVPELAAVDNPRPGLVRFILERPSPRFPRELADGRLGIVAPAAIELAAGGSIRLGPTGTGPFELREREPGRTLLARNATWWGTPLGLGPGVDQLELQAVAGTALRGEDLAAGIVEAADALDVAMASRIEADPLLTVVRGGGAILGLERSVRGIETAEVDQSLADAWLTDLR